MKRNKIKILVLLLCLFSALSTKVYSQNYNYQTYPQQGTMDNSQNYPNYNYQNNNQQSNLPPLQGSLVVVPTGTSLSVTTTMALSSSVSRVGDMVQSRLSSDLYMGGGLALPAGTTIEGQVTQAESSGMGGKNGSLSVRFTTAITPDGRRIPISARIATEDGTGIIKGGSTGGRIARSFAQGAIGAGIGAALGTALAPAAGGRVGKGAVYGTAIGGGAGLLSNIVRKGKEAELPAGSQLQIILDQPLNAPGYSSNYGNNNGYQNYQQPNYQQQNYQQQYY